MTQRRRVRVRFAKQGDLRLISHRDLLRALERLFRRAGLALGMSEGFHPKPRLTFPLALPLGVRGCEEVMEIELADDCPAEEIHRRLLAASPPGLDFLGVEELPLGTPKARVVRVEYRFPVPTTRQAEAQIQIERLWQADSYRVDRPDRQTTVDLRPWLDELQLDQGELRIGMRVSAQGTGRPREVLQALGLADLERAGAVLARTRVEIDAAGGSPSPEASADRQNHETDDE